MNVIDIGITYWKQHEVAKLSWDQWCLKIVRKEGEPPLQEVSLEVDQTEGKPPL